MLRVGLVVTLTQQHCLGCATCARHRSASLEQDALDELRNHRGDRDLHVPLLSGDSGMHWHVLHRELKLDGQTPQLYDLTYAEPYGHRPDVLRRRGPVGQDITRVADVPAITEKNRGDRLQIHLVRVGLAVFPADGPPLLRKHADEELLRKVAHHRARAELPLALTTEPLAMNW